MTGVEPARPFGPMSLNHWCLPVSSHRHLVPPLGLEPRTYLTCALGPKPSNFTNLFIGVYYFLYGFATPYPLSRDSSKISGLSPVSGLNGQRFRPQMHPRLPSSFCLSFYLKTCCGFHVAPYPEFKSVWFPVVLGLEPRIVSYVCHPLRGPTLPFCLYNFYFALLCRK